MNRINNKSVVSDIAAIYLLNHNIINNQLTQNEIKKSRLKFMT